MQKQKSSRLIHCEVPVAAGAMAPKHPAPLELPLLLPSPHCQLQLNQRFYLFIFSLMHRSCN